MDNLDKIPTDGQNAQATQPQKRAWVTPTFEQVALKQALTNPATPADNDGEISSS